MGQTLCKTVEVKNLDLLEAALIEKFGWDKQYCKRISDEDLAKGKSFEVVGHQGARGVKENQVELYGGQKGNNPVIWKIDRQNIHNKEGDAAVWSGAAISRDPEGWLEYQTDEHNIGGDSSKNLSISNEIMLELKSKVFKTAKEQQCGNIPGVKIVKEPVWDDEGDIVEGEMAIPENALENGKIPPLEI